MNHTFKNPAGFFFLQNPAGFLKEKKEKKVQKTLQDF